MKQLLWGLGLVALLVTYACHKPEEEEDDGATPSLDAQLVSAIEDAGFDLDDLAVPNWRDEDEYDEIPADPKNPITEEKVLLGMYLFHETGLATEGASNREETWSCATCHHYQAGFKSGIKQAIGEGGEGFGVRGEARVLADRFDAEASSESRIPDTQLVTAPSLLNVAYQEVLFWDGRFGNRAGGVNSGVNTSRLAPSGQPLAINSQGYYGVEARAIAGWDMHGFNVTDDSVLQEESEYRDYYQDAFGSSTSVKTNAGLAVAAYLRTLLPYDAPFQRWLRGSRDDMTDTQKRGAILFFDKAGCADCHRGPALSSEVGAAEEEMFFAIGFNDFLESEITGEIDDDGILGRGGFTGNSQDNYKFKVPQLYNLADSSVFGHGGSFSSIEAVVAYKNAAEKQHPEARNIADDFDPLGLSLSEIDDLVEFLEDGLYDSTLIQRVPINGLPSEFCFPNNDDVSRLDLGC